MVNNSSTIPEEKKVIKMLLFEAKKPQSPNLCINTTMKQLVVLHDNPGMNNIDATPVRVLFLFSNVNVGWKVHYITFPHPKWNP